jgi:autotransporter family porin
MKRRIHLTLGFLTAPICIGPAFAANECGAPVGGVVTCTAPDKAGVSYSSPTALDVRLGSFNITTTGLGVTGTAGASITVGSNGAAVTNITSTGVGVNLSSTGGAGAVSLTYNGGTISGKTSAISATNAGTGGISIHTATGTSLAAGTQGINAVVSGAAGGITVDAQGTIGASTPVGGVGILANISNAGNAAAMGIAIGGAINATGDAIRTTHAGTGKVTVDVNAAATSATGNGLRATTTSGDIAIGATANITGKTGISATTSGTGPTSTGKIGVVIGSNVIITSTNGNALAASSAGTNGITIATGVGSAVQATNGTAISASVSGTSSGDIKIDTHGTVQSTGSGSGITASVGNNTNTTNPGNIDIHAYAAVAGASTGISGSVFGIGNTTITTDDTVTGSVLDGVAATARKGGKVVVTINALVTGQRKGLSLGTAATGETTANVNANVTGTTGEAISAVSGLIGGTTVNVGNNVMLTAGRFGILALAGGDGSTLTGIAGSTTVTTGSNVTINAASWNAIEADADGGGNVTVTTGTGSMSGTNAIFSRTSVGPGTVKIDTSGNLTGTNVVGPGGAGGRGIWVAASGTGGIDIKTAVGATITADSDGILATSNAASGTAATNAIRIDEGSTINAARGRGVRAEITGAGNAADVFLSSHADITGGTDGASLGTAGSGALKVSNAGLLKGLAGAGLSAQSTTGAIAIAINSSGTVMGSVAGISLSGGSAQIDNAGTVQNLSGAPSGLAIKSTGGATSINNTGLVTGTVVLGDLGNSFTNTGRWNTSGGINDFGAGTANAVVNASGGTIVAAQNPALAETTTFSRLTSFTNNGVLSMQDGAVGDRTVITGNYASNGGTLRMDVDTLALKSDLLVLDGGAATGSTAIVLGNTATMGAMTTGNGIELVDTINGATTSAGAFRLGARVAAGAYEYLLYRGGNAATGGNTNDQNFYLRSTVEVSTPPTDPTAPAQPAPPVAVLPNYRNEVFVDMAAPSLASRFGLAMAGTLDERIGNTASASSPAWGRAFGEFGRVNPGAFAAHGPSYSFNMRGFQTGLDVWRQGSPEGARDAVGVYVGAGRIDADVNNSIVGGRAGTAKLDGYAFGAYWTHHAPHGGYTDVVLQGTRYDPVSTSSLQGQTLRSNGSGYLASLEGGYRFDLGNDWSVTPQAQLIHQRISLHGGADAYGRIDHQASNMSYARVGAKVSKTTFFGEGANAKEMTFWARANLWHGAGGDATTTFANLAGGNAVALKTDLGGTWANLGVGATGQIWKNVSAFAVGDYNVSVGGRKSHSVSLKAGLTARW